MKSPYFALSILSLLAALSSRANTFFILSPKDAANTSTKINATNVTNPADWPKSVFENLSKIDVGEDTFYYDPELFRINTLKGQIAIVKALNKAHKSNFRISDLDPEARQAVVDMLKLHNPQADWDKSGDVNMTMHPVLMAECNPPGAIRPVHMIRDFPSGPSKEIKDSLKEAPLFILPKDKWSTVGKVNAPPTIPNVGFQVVWQQMTTRPEATQVAQAFGQISQIQNQLRTQYQQEETAALGMLAKESGQELPKPSDKPVAIKDTPDFLYKGIESQLKLSYGLYGFNSASEATDWVQSGAEVTWSFRLAVGSAISQNGSTIIGYVIFNN